MEPVSTVDGIVAINDNGLWPKLPVLAHAPLDSVGPKAVAGAYAIHTAQASHLCSRQIAFERHYETA
jgi:hypothetical protein